MTETTGPRRPPGRAPGRWAVPVLLALTVIGWGGNLVATYQIARAQKAQLITCEFHAVQQFDVAISARTRASNASTSALQNLIITVFTPHGTRVAERRADLAAYGAWRAAIARQEGIALPALPRTACG